MLKNVLKTYKAFAIAYAVSFTVTLTYLSLKEAYRARSITSTVDPA